MFKRLIAEYHTAREEKARARRAKLAAAMEKVDGRIISDPRIPLDNTLTSRHPIPGGERVTCGECHGTGHVWIKRENDETNS